MKQYTLFNRRFLFLLLAISYVSCTEMRYRSIPRNDTNIGISIANTSKDNEAKPIVYTIKKPRKGIVLFAEIKTPIKADAFFLPNLKKVSIAAPKFSKITTEPEDSIEVDLKAETLKAERLGKLGYSFARIATLGLLFYPFLLLYIIGFTLSAIALYKIQTYDLKVKNYRNVINGFVINLIGLLILALIIGLIFLLLI